MYMYARAQTEVIVTAPVAHPAGTAHGAALGDLPAPIPSTMVHAQ